MREQPGPGPAGVPIKSAAAAPDAAAMDAPACGATLSGLFFDHLQHALALLLLVARLGDVLSTRLATPRLRLEANPVVRRLGWPFAWLSLLLCLLPYLPGYGTVLALPVLVASLLVSAGNFSRAWALRALGEEASVAHLHRVLSRAKPWQVYGSQAVSSLFLVGTGGLLLLFYPRPDAWAFYFAWGIVAYGLATWLYGTLSMRRGFRQLRSGSPPA